eukprot:gb/GECG01004337.1/.p1 GENE.gb/GECG01004337.1/~~gb/GECG01004337.1/.p1  ORF type:complete len:301 (+),score=37.37 gb/GECG01004337.1/:1-903(+)
MAVSIPCSIHIQQRERTEDVNVHCPSRSALENAIKTWKHEGPTKSIFIVDVSDVSELETEKLIDLLPEVEQTRIMRLRRFEDRRNSAAAHILVRFVVGVWSGYEQSFKIRLPRSDNNRPMLDEHLRHVGLDFNVSHSGSLVGVALSQGGNIGFDICEMQHRDDDFFEYFNTVFCNDEWEYILCSEYACSVSSFLPSLGKFYLVWSLKEAVLKLAGIGLLSGTRQVKLPMKETHKVQESSGTLESPEHIWLSIPRDVRIDCFWDEQKFLLSTSSSGADTSQPPQVVVTTSKSLLQASGISL